MASLISLENDVLRSYLFYSTILILKMMFMSFFTGSKRFKHKAFANPEDAQKLKLKPKTDENVERVRRAHLNDIENIPLFFVAAVIYILTNPTPSIAKMLFLVYTVARIAHTFVYAVVPIPQPARGISWFIGTAITGYMTITSLLHFMV
ncbi:microsomal glutathione S-transferase 1-like [Diorhabda carinulata]|uniref:microsomal glutathione S-transferase 1-like n=1 Tax=Diorhabda carinulata TaxID=1163345 RepID=UPI0025A1DC51|nr:microsomal glutathione S-transferase 1-like [Diorhabda carinulata]